MVNELFMNNPLALAGLAVARGQDVGAAILQGAQASHLYQTDKMKLAEHQRQQQFLARAPELLAGIDPSDLPGSFGKLIQAGADPQIASALVTQLAKSQRAQQNNSIIAAIARSRGINIPMMDGEYNGIGTVPIPPPTQETIAIDTGVEPLSPMTPEELAQNSANAEGADPASLDAYLAAQQSGGMQGTPAPALPPIGMVDIPPPPARGGSDAEAMALMAGLSPALAPLANVVGEQSRAERDAAIRAQERADDKAGKEKTNIIDRTFKINNNYQKESQNFIGIRDGFERIQASIEDPSAAGDLSLIFSYMKVLDPLSVVREGEQASAQNAAGVPDQVRNVYNKVRTGERLSEEQRKDFYNTGLKLYRKAARQQKAVYDRYIQWSGSLGVNPEFAVPNLLLDIADSVPSPTSPQPNAPQDLTPEEMQELQALEEKYGRQR